MKDDVKKYFLEQYGKAKFSVVPGHWPDFKSTDEVDEWINSIEKISQIYPTTRDTTDFKREYNKYLIRHCRAEVYFDDNKIPVKEKEKFLPEYKNIRDNLNRLLNTFDLYGIKYTVDEALGGFLIEDKE